MKRKWKWESIFLIYQLIFTTLIGANELFHIPRTANQRELDSMALWVAFYWGNRGCVTEIADKSILLIPLNYA